MLCSGTACDFCTRWLILLLSALLSAFQTTPALSLTSAASSPSLSSPSLMEEEDAPERGRVRHASYAGNAEASGSGSGSLAQRDADGDAEMGERDGAAAGEEWKSLSRVSNFPLVNTALRAYEHSKASSRVVKVRARSAGRGVF